MSAYNFEIMGVRVENIDTLESNYGTLDEKFVHIISGDVFRCEVCQRSFNEEHKTLWLLHPIDEHRLLRIRILKLCENNS